MCSYGRWRKNSRNPSVFAKISENTFTIVSKIKIYHHTSPFSKQTVVMLAVSCGKSASFRIIEYYSIAFGEFKINWEGAIFFKQLLKTTEFHTKIILLLLFIPFSCATVCNVRTPVISFHACRLDTALVKFLKTSILLSCKFKNFLKW